MTSKTYFANIIRRVNGLRRKLETLSTFHHPPQKFHRIYPERPGNINELKHVHPVLRLGPSWMEIVLAAEVPPRPTADSPSVTSADSPDGE